MLTLALKLMKIQNKRILQVRANNDGQEGSYPVVLDVNSSYSADQGTFPAPFFPVKIKWLNRASWVGPKEIVPSSRVEEFSKLNFNSLRKGKSTITFFLKDK